MNRSDYDQLVAAAIAEAAAIVAPFDARTHHALTVLSQRVADATRSYELLNLRTVDDLAAEFGLSPRRIRALAVTRHERYGIGMKIGTTWLWSASEIERMRPGAPGRPRGNSQQGA